MIIILGLLIMIVAGGLGVAGVAANSGSGHSTGIDVELLGMHLSGLSTGQLFLYGIVVGAAGMLGLSMLLGAFARRAASAGSRRELGRSREETVAVRADRDRVTRQLNDEHTERLRANTSTDVTTPAGGGTANGSTHSSPHPGVTRGEQSSARTPVMIDRPRLWDRLHRPTRK